MSFKVENIEILLLSGYMNRDNSKLLNKSF